MNSSDTARFEQAYRRIFGALRRPDDPDLSQHEATLLQHVAAGDGIALTDLATHLGLPKSSASVVVKDLERRGFVHRRRDTTDERRLSITLSAAGKRRVAADSVLDPHRLSTALESLSPDARARLIADLEILATRAELTRPQHRSHR